MPPPNGHLPYLDGWRGVAIISVLIGHFTSVLPMGSFGVSVFFVLSGLLMARILFVEKPSLQRFLRRRFARIVPLFWLYLLVVFGGGWIFLNTFDPAEIVPTALFLRTYFPQTSIFRSDVPIGHVWSLNVEEHSYMLLAVLGLLAARYGEWPARVALTGCALLCVAFFVLYKYHPPSAQTWFINRSEVAALPLLLSAALFLWGRRFPARVTPLLPLVSFLAALAVALFWNSVAARFLAVSVLLALSINTLAAAPPWALKFLCNPVLRWFGVCSYSIYLWQQVFYFFGPHYPGVAYYNVMAVALTLAVAACSFYFFEQPVRRKLTASMSGRAASERT